MDKAWWGEPDRPETVVVVLGNPVVTYDMMKDAGLV